MSQLQSEVRPTVVRMPMSGFLLQTGGSARRRVIKPLKKQAGTDVFPIQNEYRVSGVPGHTHNSSAVASVIVDMFRTRGFTHSFDSWSEQKIEMDEKDPGDSERVTNEDIRFNRALERGIGEICLRPENCHHEIREPVRSIAEIRTLVAPDDRLQTLTYVEEVGGFVTKVPDVVPLRTVDYISEFPDVYIDLLGYRDIDKAPKNAFGHAHAGGYTNDSATTPLRIGIEPGDVEDVSQEHEIVVLRPADKTQSIGYFDDATPWFGIVRFRWDANDQLYRSELFDVTLRRVIQVNNDSKLNVAAQTLKIRFPAMETSQAEHGYCFLMNSNINNTQAVKNALKSNSNQFRPRIPIDVLDVTKSVQGKFRFEPDCAFRIMVGGKYSFPGFASNNEPLQDDNVHSYFEQIANMRPKNLAKEFDSAFVTLLTTGAGDQGAQDALWASATRLLTNAHGFSNLLNGKNFTMFNTVDQTRFPQVFPRNNQSGAAFGGYLRSPAPSRCAAPVGGDLNVVAGGNVGTTHYLDVAGEDTGAQLITKALITMMSGAETIDDQWRKTAAGAKQIQFDEDSVNFRLDESAVRPPKFPYDTQDFGADPNEVGSFWNWKQHILPTITTKALNAAQVANLQIPDSTSWYHPKNSGNKKMFVRGTLLDDVPNFKLPAFFEHKLIMVPAQFEFYYNGEEFGFTYVNVAADGTALGQNDVGDFDKSYLEVKAPRVSQRFYIVGDVEAENVAEESRRFGVTFDTSPVFALNTISNHVPNKPVRITDVRLPKETRTVGGHEDDNLGMFKEGFGVGTIFECVQHAVKSADTVLAGTPDVCRYPDNRLPVVFQIRHGSKYRDDNDVAAVELCVQNLCFSFAENRTFFMCTNKVGARGAVTTGAVKSGYYFHTQDCKLELATETGSTDTDPKKTCLVTVIERLYNTIGKVVVADDIGIGGNAALVSNQEDILGFCHLGADFQSTWFGAPSGTQEVESIFNEMLAESNLMGPVFQSKRQISQHLCAPILNPNMRIGCTAPLNFETGHLPPELRDFRLELRDVDFSFLPGKVNLEPLVLYEFNGGNQVVSAHDNLLHLPQFREESADVQQDGTFEFEQFSPYGMPSHIAIFCRDEDRSRDHMVQPLIKQLSIMCTTTQKPSNTILDANVHQLYHITQRNVNQRARYNRTMFNDRQVILMSAEDIGMMGLEFYQNEKRAKFKFTGKVDQIGRVTAVLIFNNRGLYIQGKHMSIVRLQD
jgi:hypothetical protein